MLNDRFAALRLDLLDYSFGSRAGLCELNLVAADLSVELACHTANERARHVLQGWAQRQTATIVPRHFEAPQLKRNSRSSASQHRVRSPTTAPRHSARIAPSR